LKFEYQAKDIKKIAPNQNQVNLLNACYKIVA